MFKRCLIAVLLLVSGCCAWGQRDGNLNIDYEAQTWTSWTGNTVISLWGTVYVVKPGEKADLDVRIEKDYNYSDIDVYITCRKDPYKKQWRFVNSRKEADFSIRFVEKDEHFSVRFISFKEWDEWWNFSVLDE